MKTKGSVYCTNITYVGFRGEISEEIAYSYYNVYDFKC